MPTSPTVLPPVTVIIAAGAVSLSISPPTDATPRGIGRDTPEQDRVEPIAHTEPLIQEEHPWIGGDYDSLRS